MAKTVNTETFVALVSQLGQKPVGAESHCQLVPIEALRGPIMHAYSSHANSSHINKVVYGHITTSPDPKSLQRSACKAHKVLGDEEGKSKYKSKVKWRTTICP